MDTIGISNFLICLAFFLLILNLTPNGIRILTEIPAGKAKLQSTWNSSFYLHFGIFIWTNYYNNREDQTILKDYGTHDIKFYDMTIFLYFFRMVKSTVGRWNVLPLFAALPFWGLGIVVPVATTKAQACNH